MVKKNQVILRIMKTRLYNSVVFLFTRL